MTWTTEAERKYLSELLEYHLNELKDHYYKDQPPPHCHNALGLPDDVFIQDPVLYHMILRSGEQSNNHYIITLPESKCVCSVSLGQSVWKDGYGHCLEITDSYRIHVCFGLTTVNPPSNLQVVNNPNAFILQGVKKWKSKLN